MRSIRTIVAWCGVVSLGACAMGGIVSISEPEVVPPTLQSVSLDAAGVLRLNGLSVSVKPQNARFGLLTVGPVVPLIPVGSGNELGKDKPFRLVVQFETSDTGYTFKTGESFLFHAGSEYRPALSAGPLSRIDVAREIQRASRGHEWVCNDMVRESADQLLRDEPIPLSRSCFVLEFPVLTPGPDQTFQVELRGMKKDGRIVVLPKIEFRPGTTSGYSVLG
jgi:hypothetical protein